MCICEFQGPSVDQGILDILRSQLERCGPDRLQAKCPDLICAAPAMCVAPGALGFYVGLFVGVLVAFLFGRFVGGTTNWTRRSGGW